MFCAMHVRSKYIEVEVRDEEEKDVITEASGRSFPATVQTQLPHFVAFPQRI